MTFNLDEYRSILFRTMHFLDEFLIAHSIHYYASGGTAIGAVRHNGIIPWDDDIDIYMPRKDYESFLRYKDSFEGTGYEIKTLGDKGYYLPFAKFCDANSTIWEYENVPYVVGVYIDIFPLDSVPNNIQMIRDLKSQYRKSWEKYSVGLYRYSEKTIIGLIKEHRWRYLASILKWRFYNGFMMQRNLKEFTNLDNRLQSITGDYLYFWDSTYAIEKEIFPKEWFGSEVRMKYEFFSISMCSGWKSYLGQLFGDYMCLPPVEERKTHHEHFYINLHERLSINECRNFLKGRL